MVKKTEVDEPFYYAKDPKKVIALGKIVEDETKSAKVRDKAATDILAEYGLPK